MKSSEAIRVAILVHGFVGKKDFMKEIEQSLSEAPFDMIYKKVLNFSLYSSMYGLDLSKPYDITTPIYIKGLKQTLAYYFLSQITTELKHEQQKVMLDIYAHSLGGLVTRAMIRYLFSETGIIIKNVILLGTPNHGTRLALKIMTIPAIFESYLPLCLVFGLCFELVFGFDSTSVFLFFTSVFLISLLGAFFVNIFFSFFIIDT